MSTIKEFYHDEICKGQQDAVNMTLEELEDEHIVSRYNEQEEDLFNSELPRWMY